MLGLFHVALKFPVVEALWDFHSCPRWAETHQSLHVVGRKFLCPHESLHAFQTQISGDFMKLHRRNEQSRRCVSRPGDTTLNLKDRLQLDKVFSDHSSFRSMSAWALGVSLSAHAVWSWVVTDAVLLFVSFLSDMLRPPPKKQKQRSHLSFHEEV